MCLSLVSPSSGGESRKVEKMIEASEFQTGKESLLGNSGALVKRGKALYHKFCIHCHGAKGNGRGKASYYLFPKPRNLNLGIFKFHSTRTNALPLNEDLYQTIQNGIPGTAMPAWGDIFSEEEIHSLAEFIKTFSRRFSMESPDHKMPVSLEPPFDKLSIANGRIMYRQLRCGGCHGNEGDSEDRLSGSIQEFGGNLSFVYDLRRADQYKAGATGPDIYRTLITGLDGSPMNAYEYLSDGERWDLVHYLQSLFVIQASKPALTDRQIYSQTIEKEIDLKPDSPIWNGVASFEINLTPVRARKNPITRLTVQSVHNDKEIAFRLEWEDPKPNGAVNDTYLDQSAVQFALNQDNILEGPFFGMGERNKPVNIWHWRADVRQRIYNGENLKPNRSHSILHPSSGLLLNPFTESSVEEINSEGFGSLSIQPVEDQQVKGMGQWKNGRWSVVFSRDKKTTSRWDIKFSNGKPVLLAFALWDGDNKDKNANKMVSFWNILTLK